MRETIFAALSGGLFGAGLVVSGMTDTTKVQGWLDVFGAWDPTLAFVMGGAILPMIAAWAIARRRVRAETSAIKSSTRRRTSAAELACTVDKPPG